MASMHPRLRSTRPTTSQPNRSAIRTETDRAPLGARGLFLARRSSRPGGRDDDCGGSCWTWHAADFTSAGPNGGRWTRVDRLSHLETAACRPPGRGPRSTDDPLSQAGSFAIQVRLAQPAFAQDHGGGTAGLGFRRRAGGRGDASGEDGRSRTSDGHRSTALIDWINPQALAATVFILVFFGCTTLLGLGLGALLKVTLLRERLRLSTSSALYPGPGLKGHPRLEP